MVIETARNFHDYETTSEAKEILHENQQVPVSGESWLREKQRPGATLPGNFLPNPRVPKKDLSPVTSSPGQHVGFYLAFFGHISSKIWFPTSDSPFLVFSWDRD